MKVSKGAKIRNRYNQVPDVLNWSEVKHESKCVYTQTLQSDTRLIVVNEQEICTVSDIGTLYDELLNRLNNIEKRILQQ